MAATELTEVDRLKLQLAMERAKSSKLAADMALSVSRGADADFEQEKTRVIAAYEVGADETVDIGSGTITRKLVA